MENVSGITDILLLDSYSEESEMLYRSFRQAGFGGKAVVIEDNGFLPGDVINVYQHFCGDLKHSSRALGVPRYFNQIDAPDYWEISGNNNFGSVHDMERERGRIFYAEPKHRRLVRVVDWMDEKGTVRSSDHYNQYGALYARTFFNKEGKRFCKAYFDAGGREALVENFVTHDIILNRDGKVYVMKDKTELALKALEEMGLSGCRIFYNTLSTPLFVSERLPGAEKRDVLFWQEGARNDIPGNMQMILDGKLKRTKKIYVQKKDSYEKLMELGASKEIVSFLGYVYEFTGRNRYQDEALICTNSDQVEQCGDMIRELPQMHFHIAALTEMSSKLLELSQYDNVSLYPGVRPQTLEELFHSCDYYLDINHGPEIVSAVRRAFLHNQLVLGFANTLHNKAFTAPGHVFDHRQALVSFLKTVMGKPERIEAGLEEQRKAAMAENTESYQALWR